MSRDKPVVISIGDLAADLVVSIPEFPIEEGKHQVIDKVQIEPGGAGNFLIAGARLGMHMMALGAIGEDVFGDFVLQVLQDEGVDVQGVSQQANGVTTTVFVLVDGDGMHVFLGQYGYGPELEFSLTWQKQIDQADAILISGYSLSESRLLPSLLQAIEYGWENHLKVFFDPGPLFNPTLNNNIVDRIFTRCSGLLLTEAEIGSITSSLKLPAMSLEDTAGELFSRYNCLDLICVKRGSEGCWVSDRSQSIFHSGYNVDVVDTTGAGDAFNAAFLSGYLKNWPLSRAAEFANAMGAAKVMKWGSGRNMPTLEEVNALYSPSV